MADKKLVVQSADASQQRARQQKIDPFVAAKVNPLRSPGYRKEIEKEQCYHDANPLPQGQPFCKNQDSPGQCPERTGSPYRRNNGQRQVFYREKGKHPRSGNDYRFQKDKAMRPDIDNRDIEKRPFEPPRLHHREHHQRGKDYGAGQCREEEHRDNGILVERQLFKEVVSAEEHGRYHCKKSPHGNTLLFGYKENPF